MGNQRYSKEEEFINAVKSNHTILDSIEIICNFRGFKIPHYEDTAIIEKLSVQFSPYYYRISSSQGPSNIIIKKRYSQNLQIEESNKLISLIGKRVTAHIKQVIDNANKPK